jgi:hypothetical protein
MTKPVEVTEPPAEDKPKTVFDLLHAIVDKLNIHQQEKADLHADIDDSAPPVETESPDNGNAN